MADITLDEHMDLIPPIWVMDGGREIALEDMSPDHVANCLRDLEAKKITRPGCNCYTNAQWIEIFRRELRGRNLSKVKL